MSTFFGFVIWGLVTGFIAGPVLDRHLASDRRTNIVRWCLLIGFGAVVYFGIVAATGASFPTNSRVQLLALLGFPSLVAGIYLVVADRRKGKAFLRK
jgi:multisubunit Na+/H+ antiporter MnhE subunit